MTQRRPGDNNTTQDTPPTRTQDVMIQDKLNSQHTGDEEEIDRKFKLFQEDMLNKVEENFRYLKATADYALQYNNEAKKARLRATDVGLWRHFEKFAQECREKDVEIASIKSTADHALRTAFQIQDRSNLLDRELERQSLRCTRWMSEVDETLKTRFEQFVNALNTDKADLEQRAEGRSNGIEIEMREHVDKVTRWRNAVDDGLTRRLETHTETLWERELEPGLKALSQKIDRCYENQQRLILLMEVKVSELDDKIRATVSDGLKFQVKVSLQKVEAPEEDCASPDSVLGVVCLNRDLTDMLHVEN
jgi:hypothetical protein